MFVLECNIFAKVPHWGPLLRMASCRMCEFPSSAEMWTWTIEVGSPPVLNKAVQELCKILPASVQGGRAESLQFSWCYLHSCLKKNSLLSPARRIVGSLYPKLPLRDLKNRTFSCGPHCSLSTSKPLISIANSCPLGSFLKWAWHYFVQFIDYFVIDPLVFFFFCLLPNTVSFQSLVIYILPFHVKASSWYGYFSFML